MKIVMPSLKLSVQ